MIWYDVMWDCSRTGEEAKSDCSTGDIISQTLHHLTVSIVNPRLNSSFVPYKTNSFHPSYPLPLLLLPSLLFLSPRCCSLLPMSALEFAERGLLTRIYPIMIGRICFKLIRDDVSFVFLSSSISFSLGPSIHLHISFFVN